MKKERIIKRRYLIIIAFLVAINFIASLIVSHYITQDIGKKMGHIVAEGLNEAYQSQKPSDADKIYKDMRHKADTIIASRNTVIYISYALSLPTEPFLKPFWEWIGKEMITKPALSKEITREQFTFRSYALHYFMIGFNSTILMKLWYWVVDTKINVLKEMKQLQLQITELKGKEQQNEN